MQEQLDVYSVGGGVSLIILAAVAASAAATVAATAAATAAADLVLCVQSWCD